MIRLGRFDKYGYMCTFSKGELARELVCMNNDYDKLEKENQKYKEVINKAIELLGNYKHYSTPDEEQNSTNEALVNKAFDLLKEVEVDADG